MEADYLPRHPPAELTPFALHVAARRRVVGSSQGRHVLVAWNRLETEAQQIGRGATLAVQVTESRDHARCKTDIARYSGLQLREEPQPAKLEPPAEARARLTAFRKMRAKEHEDARIRRVEVENGAVSSRPGGNVVEDALRLVAAVRRAKRFATLVDQVSN